MWSSAPWLLGHRFGIQLQLLPQFIIPHICIFLVFPCQGEPGKFGEPGDPGEDVSRRHIGVVGGYWGQWVLLGAGICASATYCPGAAGGLVSSQGAKGSSGAKGEKVRVPCPQGVPQPGSGWHDGPGTPVPPAW